MFRSDPVAEALDQMWRLRKAPVGGCIYDSAFEDSAHGSRPDTAPMIIPGPSSSVADGGRDWVKRLGEGSAGTE